ncbi:hypothetical protein SAMD00023353_1002160 [Rosellinia necatrix]|uniref:Uncharacterized protein n=1 Tax=Rosellinia necatrix TaxID=77044 RepID=A0A1W2TBK6_ROSNE|nr:hypothetical protein SAMD00023353_1002160 [Rosellinia necatrix]
MAFALTTTFTQPPECRIPFILESDCLDGPECGGSYAPLLFFPFSGPASGSRIQCLPKVKTNGDGSVEAIYTYDPGLICPRGLTTDTKIGTAFVCCPTGLTYTASGQQDACYGTVTEGPVLVGFTGAEESTVFETFDLAAADQTTIHVAARAVFLVVSSSTENHARSTDAPPGLTSSATTDSPIFIGAPTSSGAPSQETVTTMSRRDHDGESEDDDNKDGGDSGADGDSSSGSGGDTTTACLGHCGTTDTSPTVPRLPTPAGNPVNQTKTMGKARAIFGAVAGGVVGFLLLVLIIGYLLIVRYRRKRLGRKAAASRPRANPGRDDVEAAAAAAAALRKPPPRARTLPVVAELEGTGAEDRSAGAGIYVAKPELEGTAGMPGLAGVYVRRKAELEAGHLRGGLPRHAPIRPGAVAELPESPVVGSSSAGLRFSGLAAGVIRTHI